MNGERDDKTRLLPGEPEQLVGALLKEHAAWEAEWDATVLRALDAGREGDFQIIWQAINLLLRSDGLTRRMGALAARFSVDRFAAVDESLTTRPAADDADWWKEGGALVPDGD